MKKAFTILILLVTIILTLNIYVLGKYTDRIRVGSFNLTITDDEHIVYLIEGEQFNKMLKQNTNTIIFDIYDKYPDFRDRDDGLNCGIYLDEQIESDYIKLFYEKNTAYVLSETTIYANPNSNALFKNCLGLSKIDFNAFDTSNVVNAKEMFYSCISLRTLNISAFDSSKIENMQGMFQYCLFLNTIYVSKKWVTDKVTNGSSMFVFCLGLVGEQNTRYLNVPSGTRDSYIYAKIDGGTSDPGYFSELKS